MRIITVLLIVISQVSAPTAAEINRPKVVLVTMFEGSRPPAAALALGELRAVAGAGVESGLEGA